MSAPKKIQRDAARRRWAITCRKPKSQIYPL